MTTTRIDPSVLTILHCCEGTANKLYIIDNANRITAYGRVGKPLKFERTDKDLGKLKAAKLKKGYVEVSAVSVGLEGGLPTPDELFDDCVKETAADFFVEEMRPIINKLAELTNEPYHLGGHFHDDGDEDGGFIVLANPRGSSAQSGFVGPALDGTLWDEVPDSIMKKAELPEASGEGDVMFVAINTKGEICYFLHDEWKNYEEKSQSDGWTYNWRVGCGDYFLELKNYYSYDLATARNTLEQLGDFGIDLDTLTADGIEALGDIVLETNRVETYQDHFDGLCVGHITVPEFDEEAFLEEYQVKDEVMSTEEFVTKLLADELAGDDEDTVVQPQFVKQFCERATWVELHKRYVAS